MDYDSMTGAELESELNRLKSTLDDLEEVINFNLTYSSAHIGGAEVRRDEERLQELKKKIRRIEELLSQKTSR